MSELVRDLLRDLSPYTAVEAGEAVDLSDNTSLWGPPPQAVDALRAVNSAVLARYPAIPPAALNRALAAYAGVREDMIVVGCGSDDLIDCAMRTFAQPGDTIAFAVPTFSMVPTFAAINGLRAYAVPFTPALDLDVEALLASNPRFVYLCSPNNPTGTALPRSTIERVLREAPGTVLLDEAYGEFSDAPGFSLARSTERLIVTRTLSKAFGLAGLRIGYAVLAPALARALETVRGPYKLNAAAAAAAAAALTDGLSWVQEHATEAVAVRRRLAAELTEAGLAPLPSDANFVCVPCRQAERLGERLLARGIAVRVLRGLPPVTAALAASNGAALRIGVGPWSVMERLLSALREEGAACA
ncbi:MAG TPA: aminotransferase class I/II-fold pyridoxal phosphate-dependent enzyme [Gemmatimonadaceae bacterium]|nr:aminotransferase class I/II-fold pyridoxal phosphate-dependent enzyme [Gemmatimonadaceae bacterium]